MMDGLWDQTELISKEGLTPPLFYMVYLFLFRKKSV